MTFSSGARRFEEVLRDRSRPRRLILVVELLLTVALIAGAAFFIWQMIEQIAQGRLQGQQAGFVWTYAGPALGALTGLALLLVRHVYLHWAGQIRLANSGLRRRLVAAFTLVSLVPTAVLLGLSVLYFVISFSGWIERTLQNTLKDQEMLSSLYSQGLQNRIEQDIASKAQTVSSLISSGAGSAGVERFLQESADLGGYWHLYIYTATGTPRLRFGPGQNFDPILPSGSFRETEQSLLKVTSLNEGERLDQLRVLAVVPDIAPPLFLYGSQRLGSAFLQSAEAALQARAELESFEARLSWVFFLVSLVLLSVGLVFLLASILLGIWFANRMLEPISNIIAAATEMGEGFLEVRVPVSARQFPEFQTLSNAFNIMAGQLERQQLDVLDANAELEERRQFTAAVLSGVSAGVVGLGANFDITLPNHAASDLLGLDLDTHLGQDIRQLIPEFAPVLARAAKGEPSLRAQEIKLFHKTEGHLLVLLASVFAESNDGEVFGYVVTFDDVSVLVSAQRQSAWSEVARRIAHEIKNPLTPIELSTARLQRRYGEKIPAEDREVFDLCLETISRQVETISRLVNEFSSFTRMPTATLREIDLCEVIRQSFFLQSASFAAQDWQLDIPEIPVKVNGDPGLLNQAFQNLLKNAGESSSQGEARAEISLSLVAGEGGQSLIRVKDSGPGFAAHVLEKLGEPYVSTKAEGTGLGLAIVKKIIEDHGGTVSGQNSEDGGAVVTLSFPPFAQIEP